MKTKNRYPQTCHRNRFPVFRSHHSLDPDIRMFFFPGGSFMPGGLVIYHRSHTTAETRWTGGRPQGPPPTCSASYI